MTLIKVSRVINHTKVINLSAGDFLLYESSSANTSCSDKRYNRRYVKRVSHICMLSFPPVRNI